MTIDHFEILVEEPSMEAFLYAFLPSVLPQEANFSIYTYSGKHDLLKKLPARLQGYSQWIPNNYGIVVILDRDDDDCTILKDIIEDHFRDNQIITRASAAGGRYNGLSRIAIEELEAWYFGNWPAVCRSYTSLPTGTDAKAKYRNSDEITGGTWEAFERECKKHGLFVSGLRKVEAAREIGSQVDFRENKSPSLQKLVNGLLEMTNR